MRNKAMKIISLLCLLLLITSLTACTSKDKETIISRNVSQRVKNEENQIEKNIESGNKYLGENKYDEAKKTYEKAISINVNNKQTYLQIKDKYLEKARIDDAFYIVKLAVNNNVDISNMKAVLEDIKKKFDVATIEKSVYQNDTFALPKQVMVKVNNVDTQADVKWNTSAMDTSKIGSFTLEGTAVQYERPVKITLKVNAGISDEQVVSLLDSAYQISTVMLDEFIIYPKPDVVNIPISPNISYVKLPDELNSKESIYKHFVEKYGINKYCTGYYVESLIDNMIKEYNGKYYAQVGQIGIAPIIKESKIKFKKYDRNTVDVVYSSIYPDVGKAYNFNATLIYIDGKWLIDKTNFIFPIK